MYDKTIALWDISIEYLKYALLKWVHTISNRRRQQNVDSKRFSS